MHVPITVNYTPDGEDWTVTVAVTGEDEAHRATAPGLIAARVQADQLAAQIEPNDDQRRVVHLLDGDAFAFTTSYLHARLGLTESPTPAPPPPARSTDQVINGAESPAPPWPDATVEAAENA
jgi:hypothetical protein